jgi:hypothetical protein
MIMNTRLDCSSILFLVLIPFVFGNGCGKQYRDAPSSAANVELSGMLSLRGSQPFPMLILEERGGKDYLLRSSSLLEELKRLSGMAVVLTGVTPAGTQAPLPVMEVESYRLLPLPGGEQPVVGRIHARDEGCFIEREDGTEMRIAGEFEPVLKQYADAKIWVIGEILDGDTKAFIVKGYGVIVPPPRTQ